MRDTLYTARPGLADPAGFLATAFHDLRASLYFGWRLFVADLRARNRQALLGYLWLVIPAAAAALLCGYLRANRIVAVGATELPFALHVLAGFLLWQVFTDALNSPLQRLLASRQLLTRTRVTHEAILVGGALAVGLNALVRLVLLLAIVVGWGFAFAPAWLLLPVGFLAIALFGFFIGMLAAPWGLLFGDVRQGLNLIAGFWFFLTPVFYPAPTSGPLLLNPMTPLLDTTRSWISGGDMRPGFLVLSLVSLLGLLLVWLAYRLARPHLISRLG